jgi:hypothetical protein
MGNYSGALITNNEVTLGKCSAYRVNPIIKQGFYLGGCFYEE